MSITLKESGFGPKRDSFGQTLAETNEFFAQTYKTNVIGADFASVATDNALFESYVARLTEGFTPAQAEVLETLLENSRMELLTENSLTGIQPFHSLSTPMIVKLWARLTLTQAVPTVPTKTPAFTVPYMKPFMITADGDRVELPESINNTPEKAIGLKQLKEDLTLAQGKLAGHDLFDGVKGTVRKGIDTIDRNFTLVSIEYPNAGDAGLGAGKVPLTRSTIVAGSPKLDDKGNLFVKVKYVDSGNAQTLHEDTIIGHVDLEKGTIDVTSFAANATKINIRGFVSSEAHTTSTQLELKIERKDVTVGTAAHIEASMPLEMLQDTAAMYDIDGAALITEQMTNVSAQKVDLDIIEFLEKVNLENGAQFTKSFDVYPSAQYAFNPKDWLDGLRKTIDWVATSMRNYFKSYDAYFVVVGNPLDTDLIPNVDWTFRQIEDSVNGIDVQYSIGAVRGSNHYKIISSDLVAQGELTILAVPTRDDYKSVVFYPYTFNVTNKYLNTRNAAVPSLMMTRRYTMEQFIPMIGKVKILNNDGTVYATPKYPGRA